MLMTVAVHDLARGIIFIRSSPSVLDFFLVREVSKLRGIYRYIAKLAYMITKMT